MCFNWKISLLTFFIGVSSSLLLIRYGNPKYKKENLVSGVFLIFIAMIQFMDFLLWVDIKNKWGVNKITTILGPILNVGQPTILYLVKLYFLQPKLLRSNESISILVLNILYVLVFFYNYFRFLSESPLITGVKHKHLDWPWIKYSNSVFYLILFALNMFYLFNFKYAFLLFFITYFFLFLSYKYFYYNIGELWCFFGIFIPFLMILVSYLI
jgi:hypothetical protein